MNTPSVCVLAAVIPWILALAQGTAPRSPWAVLPPVEPMRVSLVLNPQAAPATAPAAAPTITLHERHGHVTPIRQGFTHTGAGNIDVAQPSPDTLIVTMTGVAVAGGHPTQDSLATLEFDLEQWLEVSGPDPKTTKLKVTMEARAIGLLRSHAACRPTKPGKGIAEMSCAHAALTCGGGEVISLALEPHHVGGGDNLSLNDHSGPQEAPIVAGKYILHQKFTISAAHPRSVLPCKAASAEFAPDPALDPLWISYREPFHGAVKKDFGFQIILKVAADAEGK